MLAGTTMLFSTNKSIAKEKDPVVSPSVRNPQNRFLPDIAFSSAVYQHISNPIIWNDDRSLAVIDEETASGALCYTFWCFKRNAQGTMVPLAKYKIWTDLLKKGILLDQKGLTVMLEGSGGITGTTSITHHFPFTIPQAQISFLRKGQEHLNRVEHDDLEKEWKQLLER